MSTKDSPTTGWYDKLVNTAKATLISAFPVLGAVNVAKDFISEQLAERIRAEAHTKAQAILSQVHRDTLRTIAWQNGALLLSIVPVYFLHSPWPFYLAYACVASYTVYSIWQERQLLLRLCGTRSVTQTVSTVVREAIELELTKRQFIERKAVEWLGPDLQTISDDVARRLKPDVIATVINMAFTLLLAFLAFRVYAIPLLEHKALGY